MPYRNKRGITPRRGRRPMKGQGRGPRIRTGPAKTSSFGGGRRRGRKPRMGGGPRNFKRGIGGRGPRMRGRSKALCPPGQSWINGQCVGGGGSRYRRGGAVGGRVRRPGHGFSRRGPGGRSGVSVLGNTPIIPGSDTGKKGQAGIQFYNHRELQLKHGPFAGPANQSPTTDGLMSIPNGRIRNLPRNS